MNMIKKPAPTLRIVMAFLFDFVLSMSFFGYIIAWMRGEIIDGGFHLDGIPSLFGFLFIYLYFLVMKKYFNGTFGKKIFGVTKVYIEAPVNEYLEDQ